MAHNNCFENRKFIILVVVLLQNCHTLARSHMNITCVRLNFTRQNLQERRFAGTIRTDQTIAVPWRKLYIYIFEKCSFSITERYTICTDH
ncbi:hypothetical protein D3C81_1903350 [compost metagenome]